MKPPPRPPPRDIGGGEKKKNEKLKGGTKSNKSNRLAVAVTEEDHILGPTNAPITIVEYGDYECPDCFNAVPVIKQVREKLGDQMRFVFRHFPQNSIHP